MTKKLSRDALIGSLALFLSGCALRTAQSPVQIDKLDTDKLVFPMQLIPSVSSMSSIPLQFNQIEHQEKHSQPVKHIHFYDWSGTMRLMLDKMLQVQDVTVGSLLLVDRVNNRTNGFLNLKEATETLRNALVNNRKFILFSAQQLSVAKQQLGISPQDSLSLRSKTIGIARNVGVQYMLYSNAIGNVSTPSLQMQLILVQTGEIIWSGKEVVMQY